MPEDEKLSQNQLLALLILSDLQKRADYAQKQLKKAEQLLCFYTQEPLATQRCLSLYKEYLAHLEQLVCDPENAVPPDIFLI